MYQHADPLYLICETPLHVGSGSDLGIVDLPIQRERHTGFPKVESASIKGSLRTAFERRAGESSAELIKIHAAFGYDSAGTSDAVKQAFIHEIGNEGKKEETQFAGCLGFSDARLLLFPIKSMRGVFAWVTCPAVLNRYFQDCNASEKTIRLEKKDNQFISKVPQNTKLFINQKQKIILEEYAFDAKEDSALTDLADKLAMTLFPNDEYRREKLKTDLVILPDDAFGDFVTLSTEVITRTKIDNDTGTVAGGALFTEEFLPAESVLYSLVLTGPLFIKQALLDKPESPFKDFLNEDKPDANKTRVLFESFIKQTPIFQLGANASLGKGIIKTEFLVQGETK